jgi:hypothetical protein
MDPSKGLLIMQKTTKQKCDYRGSRVKSAKARLVLKRYARMLRVRQRKDSIRTRVVGKPDIG